VAKPAEVRFNEEVRGSAQVTARRDIGAGEEILQKDVEKVHDFLLAEDEDANAAHVTMLALQGGWSIAFDFRYNRGLVVEHVEAASDFIDTAADAPASDRTRPFLETCMELLS
jgi:hypothetical protein